MSSSQQLHSLKEISDLLATISEEVVIHLLPNGVRQGQEWVVGSINGEPGKSLKVHLFGNKAGIWKDFATDHGGDLIELWHLVRGVDKSTAIKEIREYLGLNTGRPRSLPMLKPVPQKTVTQSHAVPTKPINPEYHQTLQANLSKNPGAIAYLLAKRGLTERTVAHFGLGLSGTYERADGVVTCAAIVAPMRSPVSGQWLNKSAYITVPEVTTNPIHKNGWMKGSARTYFSDAIQNQTIIFVCEGIKDVWKHWQHLSEEQMTSNILLISSTHGSVIPEEWKNREFWSNWGTVYLGQDNDEPGQMIAERVLELVGGEARRIMVPKEFGKDWTDYWQNGGTHEGFNQLLKEAPVMSGAIIEDSAEKFDGIPHIGRFSHKPIDINGAYVKGFLYYPTETHVIRKDEETGQLVERLETIVVRSDRTTHRAIYAPAPAGTPLDKRVLKLTDGTVIQKEPRSSSRHSWEYESINQYLQGKAKVRPSNVLLNEILSFLRVASWLPHEEDYVVLALTVFVTYVQSAFESVPLLLLNGPPDTGKSQTGRAMAKLCANGDVIGQISAAAAARFIDETRGFVVLDDIESIASKVGKDNLISDFVQALKLSYNKHTAIKYWTDVKNNMKNEKLNFFGVKLLNNTLGTDSILGTRMLRVQTRKMPEGMVSTVRDFSVEEITRMQELRNELHTWAFMYIAEIDRIYSEVFSVKSNRHAEIAAPLRTIAIMLGDPSITKQLETCLARQHLEKNVFNDDPVETLKEAVRNLIKQGYGDVTLTHLRLEMKVLLDANYGMASTTEIPEWDRPDWVGRQLRSNDLVAPIDLGRKRVYGQNLRLVRFSDWMVEEVLAMHNEKGEPIYGRPSKAPDAFCQGCQGCPYRTAGCDLQKERVRQDNRKKPVQYN